MKHDSAAEQAEFYKQIKEKEREGDKLTHSIFDQLSTTFITPFDREDIHDLASCMDDVIDGINSCAKRINIYNPRPISDSGKELSRLILEISNYHYTGSDIRLYQWLSRCRQFDSHHCIDQGTDSATGGNMGRVL